MKQDRKVRLFLSHASEDKDFVRLLDEALKAADYDTWLDEIKIRLGDSIFKSVNDGMNWCDYGVVVLSHHYFAKRWTRDELNALYSLETVHRKVILPIWKGVTVDQVQKFAPILADRKAISTERGIDAVVDAIDLAIDVSAETKSLQRPGWRASFRHLSEDLATRRKISALANSSEGADRVREAAGEIIAEAQARIEELSETEGLFELKLRDEFTNVDRVFAQGVRGVAISLSLEVLRNDSIGDCKLMARFFYGKDYRNPGEIGEIHFRPKFDGALDVGWDDGNEDVFATKQELLDHVFEVFANVLRESLH